MAETTSRGTQNVAPQVMTIAVGDINTWQDVDTTLTNRKTIDFKFTGVSSDNSTSVSYKLVNYNTTFGTVSAAFCPYSTGDTASFEYNSGVSFKVQADTANATIYINEAEGVVVNTQFDG